MIIFVFHGVKEGLQVLFTLFFVSDRQGGAGVNKGAVVVKLVEPPS